MEAFVASGRLVELVIVFTLLETAVLLVRRRATGHGPAPSDFLLNTISGLCLMVALRAALADADWRWIAGPIVASGIVHLTDLWWRTARQPPHRRT